MENDIRKDIKDIFFNRAEIEQTEQISCNNCFEQVVVLLKDQQGHEFSLGLTSILECLEAAILNYDLPKLPSEWCQAVGQRYSLGFDDDAMY